MRDLVYFAHLLIGIGLVVGFILILLNLKKKTNWLKPLSGVLALASWIMLLPSGDLYTVFYPATKTLIKAGSWPWAHDIFMETKEHWGLLFPVVVSVAALLVWDKKLDESRKWWKMALVVAILIAVFGRIVKMGAGA